LDYISYIDCESGESGDYIVDFDINTTFQATKIFVIEIFNYCIGEKGYLFPMEG